MSAEQMLLEEKIAELTALIQRSHVDGHTAKIYQRQIADAFRKSESSAQQFAPYKELDYHLSREELLEGLEKLLSENKVDSKVSTRYLKHDAVQKVTMFILSLLLIIFGFAMIIMPAPPSFEIFTVFYFNANDGVTVMDLVSLLIIFGGVLMFVLNFNKK